MELGYFYAFVGGTFVGRFTGIIPSIIISGVLLYAVDSTYFTVEKINSTKDMVFELVKGMISK